MKRGGKRGRLVGAGVAGRKGGDACVAHGGSCDAMAQQGEGDASVMIKYLPVKGGERRANRLALTR